MANSIVAQHNLAGNALPSSQRASRLINYATAALVFLLALGGFVLSYAALWEIALAYGLPPRLAWIWPLLVDFALLVFSLAVVRASLRGQPTTWPWLLVALYTLATVTFNIIHAPNHRIAQVIAVVAPVSLFLSFETLMGMLKSEVKRGQTLLHLSELQGQLAEVQHRFDQRQAEFETTVRQQQAKLDQLATQIEEKRTQLSNLTSELKFTKKAAQTSAFDPSPSKNRQFVPGDLAALDRANQAKQAQVETRRKQVKQLAERGLAPATMANQLDLSLSTIKRDLRALRLQQNSPSPPLEAASSTPPEALPELLHLGLNGRARELAL